MINFFTGVVLYKIQDGEMNFDAARASCAQDQGFKSLNGSQLKNSDISSAIFTLSLSILILNCQCEEGARDVRVL